MSPASSDATIAVGAHNESNDRAWFSNYGDVVDIWAPGTNILSAITNDSSDTFQGTSMASPFVAGIAANILANNLYFDMEDILERMLNFSIYDVDDGEGNTDLPRAQISCEEYCGDSECDVTTTTTTTTTSTSSTIVTIPFITGIWSTSSTSTTGLI